MRLLLKFLLPILVLGASAWLAMDLLGSAPEPARKPPRPSVARVEVLAVRPTDYPVRVPSRGTVAPRTQSTLIPEVAGRILEVAPGFRAGGFFEAGDLLLKIDPSDYRNALVVARAELAQARLNLREEEAQATQARRDWDKLQMDGEPGDLALRRPQLESRRAAVAAAEARLAQAETDLRRTEIRAPYAGRVLDKRVDLGQYVSPGNVLATLYAVDYVEVRLPLTDRQAAFLDLPESYRGERSDAAGPAVTLTAGESQWQGRIVRTEGAIDLASRQIFVVAQVDDPYARHADGRPPLKVGQFVEASIEGRTLKGVYVLPRGAVQGQDRVYVITPEDKLERRGVTLVWHDRDSLIVSSGLAPGERIARTPLPFVADGAPVQVVREAARKHAGGQGGTPEEGR
jgi:multidrug efflux system membrane fusion protein